MPRLKVRGNCPKCGSSREELADTGRVTWRGPCIKKGCEGTLILRKFHTVESGGETNPDNENADPTPPTTRRGTPRKVPKVGYNKSESNNSESGSGSKSSEVPVTAGDGSGTDPAPVVPAIVPPADAGGKSKRKRREYPYGGLFNW